MINDQMISEKCKKNVITIIQKCNSTVVKMCTVKTLCNETVDSEKLNIDNNILISLDILSNLNNR